MFKKLLCSFLVFAVFCATSPVHAWPPGDNTIVNDPEGDIPIGRPLQPITSAVEYTETPTVTTAVFPFVDANGQLYDLNVNFNTRAYSLVKGGELLGVGTLTSQEAFTLQDIAQEATDDRVQCPLVCQIVIAAIVIAIERVFERADDISQCAQQMERDDAEARHDAALHCPQNGYDSQGNYCVSTPVYSAPNPAICMGRQLVSCNTSCGS